MSDGTRTQAGGSSGSDWLDLLCAPAVRLRIATSVEVGRALLTLLASWSGEASDLVTEFEAGLRGRDIPDDLFASLERHVGLRELADLTENLSDVAHSVVERPHDR